MRSLLPVLAFSILSLFVSLPAQAQWNSKAFDWGQRGFGGFPGPSGLSVESRGTMASVWGGGLREMRYGEDISEDEHNIQMPEFFAKKIRVYLRPAYSQSRHVGGLEPRRIKAPLMVFIPGIFGDGDHAMAQGMMRLFSDMGYHVLLIPNCWSRDYHSAMPIERRSYPEDEATAILAITQWAREVLGSRYVEGGLIAGESLGALTAAVAYQKDSRSGQPFFTGGATLMWPPLKIASSIQTLDRMIVSTEDLYANKCRSLLKKLKTKYRVWRGKFLTEPKPDEIECAPSIVAHYSFRKNLTELTEKILDVNKVKEDPPADLTFESFIRVYAYRYHSALDRGDRTGYLGYWLGQTSSSHLSRVQIITSVDDFINSSERWSDLGVGLRKNQFLSLTWGGHIGATNHSAFKKLIQYQFKR